MAQMSGRVAIVTGASRGIGAATARRLAALGAAVVVGYRSGSAGAEEVVASIRSQGGQAVACAGDVACPEAADTLVQAAVGAFGRLDILVNNAGEAPMARLRSITDGEWRRVLAVNLDSVFYCTRAAIPLLETAGGGAVVNVATLGVRTGGMAGAHYIAAKGAVVAFTRSAAREVAPLGIRVNAVAPPLTDTQMGRSALEQVSVEQVLGRIPLGRLARPEDIAEVIAYLAGPGAAYITGETIWISGGQ